MKKLFYIVGIIIVSVIIIVIVFGGEKSTNPQETAKKKGIEIYEKLIMDNAVTVIEKISTYASSQSKACVYKEGIFIEDPYSAEWYVVRNEIYAVNGLAKSLTPGIEYAPEGISYQTCY